MAKPVIEANLSISYPGGAAIGAVTWVSGQSPLEEVHLSADGSSWETGGSLSLPGYGTITVDTHMLPDRSVRLTAEVDGSTEYAAYSFWVRALAGGQLSDPVRVTTSVTMIAKGTPAGATHTLASSVPVDNLVKGDPDWGFTDWELLSTSNPRVERITYRRFDPITWSSHQVGDPLVLEDHFRITWQTAYADGRILVVTAPRHNSDDFEGWVLDIGSGTWNYIGTAPVANSHQNIAGTIWTHDGTLYFRSYKSGAYRNLYGYNPNIGFQLLTESYDIDQSPNTFIDGKAYRIVVDDDDYNTLHLAPWNPTTYELDEPILSWNVTWPYSNSVSTKTVYRGEVWNGKLFYLWYNGVTGDSYHGIDMVDLTTGEWERFLASDEPLSDYEPVDSDYISEVQAYPYAFHIHNNVLYFQDNVFSDATYRRTFLTFQPSTFTEPPYIQLGSTFTAEGLAHSDIQGVVRYDSDETSWGQIRRVDNKLTYGRVNAATGEWTEVGVVSDDTTLTTLPTRHAAVRHNGFIYAFAGTGISPSSSWKMMRFDPLTGARSEYPYPSSPPSSKPPWGIGLDVVGDNIVVFAYTSRWIFNTVTNQWSQVPGTLMPIYNLTVVDGVPWVFSARNIRTIDLTTGVVTDEEAFGPLPSYTGYNPSIVSIYQHGRRVFVLTNNELFLGDLDDPEAGWTNIIDGAGYVDSYDPLEVELTALEDRGFIHNDLLYFAQYSGEVRYIHLLDGEKPNLYLPLTQPIPIGYTYEDAPKFWDAQITAEGTTWEMDVYTTDPNGTVENVIFEVYNRATGEWEVTPVVNQVTQPIHFNYWAPGGDSGVRAGRLEILQEYTGHEAPPVPEGAVATARIRLILDDHKYGMFSYTEEEDDDGTWLSVTSLKGDAYPTWFAQKYGFGEFEYPTLLTIRARPVSDDYDPSATSSIRLGVESIPNGPSRPEVVGPTETLENQPISGQIVVEYPGDYTDDGPNFLAILANSDPDAEFNDNGWSSSVTVYTDEEETLGTLTLTGSASKSNPKVSYTFTPSPNMSGSGTVGLMADSGDNSPVSEGETPDGFSFNSVTFRVGEVPHPPSAPGPASIPAFDEDGYIDHVVTWTDPDIRDPEEDTGSWQLELSAVGPGGPWRSDHIDLPEVRVVIDPEDEYDTDDMENKLRITGRANVSGSYAFWGRVVDNSGTKQLFSKVTKFVGSINPKPDAPSAPVPRRMPTINKGEEVAVGTFTTVDPDETDTSWTFTVSASPSGPWSGTANLGAAIGSVSVVDNDLSDKQAQVIYTPAANFSGAYHFWLRVTDSSGLSSIPVRITGAVAGAESYGELVEVTYTSGGVTRTPLCSLTLLDLEITESVTGPGGASLKVPAFEVESRAAALNKSYEEMLEPGRIELLVWQDNLLRYRGVISRPTRRIDKGTIDIETVGVASYLDRRLNEADRSWINEEQTTIMWELVEEIQKLPYGDLGFTDGTSPTGVNRAGVEFLAGQYVSECLEELSARMEGAEWWVDPDLTFRAEKVRGTDRRGVVIFTERNTIGLSDVADVGDLATVARVTGDGVAGSYAAGSTQLAKYGRVGRHIDAPQLGTETACDALAKEVVEKRGESQPTATFTHISRSDSPLGPWDYEVGDAVTIEAKTSVGFFACDVRIINRRLRLLSGSMNDWAIELDVERIGSDGEIRRSRSHHGSRFMNEVYDRMYINPS